MLACPAGTAQATLEPDDELLPAAAVLFFSPDEPDEPESELDEEPDEELDELPFLALLFSPEPPEEPEPPSFAADEPSLAEPLAADPAGAPAVELLRLSVR
jgi:hypothetical protein